MQSIPADQMGRNRQHCQQSDIGFFGPFLFAALVPVSELLRRLLRGRLMRRGTLSVIHVYSDHNSPGSQPAPLFSNIPLFSSQDATVENLLSPLSEEIHLTRSVHARQETSDFLEGLILPSLEPLPQMLTSSHRFSLEATPMPQPLFKHMPPPSLHDILSPFPLAKKSLLLSEQSEPSAPSSSIPLPNLPQFFTLADLDTINLSDAFNAELTFLSKPDDSGYLFALTLLPRADLHLPKLQQRLTFVIDRGNSIQRERLIATKQAVLRALAEIQVQSETVPLPPGPLLWISNRSASLPAGSRFLLWGQSQLPGIHINADQPLLGQLQKFINL